MARVDLGWRGFQRLTEIEEHLRSAFPAPEVAVKELIVSNVYATNRFAEGAKENALQDETVPESFGKLLAERFPNLERLHLGGYWDTPTRFWHLRNLDGLRPLAGQLRVLQVMLNKLEDLSVLAEFGALRRLDLSFNPLTDKALEALRDLPHLEHLTLLGDSNAPTKDNDGNKGYERFSALTSLDGLGTLPALKRLYATGNRIAQLPAGLADWSALEELHLGYNQLSGAVDLPALERLRVLDLRYNGIAELRTAHLPDVVQGVVRPSPFPSAASARPQPQAQARAPRRLEELYLTSNQLKRLPENLLRITPSLKKLYFSDNPLQGEYEEFINRDENLLAAYRNLTAQFKEFGEEALHEAKVIFIGNGEVGKTSIRLRLKDPKAELPKKSDRTHLDVVQMYDFEIQNPENKEFVKFTLNVWDFGGQGKYRAVQQFFCSRNALYLYVTSHDDAAINGKDVYIDFAYWAPFVNRLSYREAESGEMRPPVLLFVLNKIDQLSKPEERKLMRRFENPLEEDLDFYADFAVSAEENTNLDQLKEGIAEALPEANPGLFQRKYPKNWLALKAYLESLRPQAGQAPTGEQRYVLSREEYFSLCARKDFQVPTSAEFGESPAETLLQTLHHIGTLIHFNDPPELADLVILDPNWLKNAAFALLGSEAIADNLGRASWGALQRVWRGAGFEEEFHTKLLDYMKKFKLCYEGKNKRGKPQFFIPALFPHTPPQDEDLEATKNSLLPEMRLYFPEFMPAGLLHRFMVTYPEQLADPETLWERGCFLHYKRKTFILLEENWQEKYIALRFHEGQGTWPEALDFVQNALSQLCEEVQKQAKLRKPIPTTLKAENHEAQEWQILNASTAQTVQCFHKFQPFFKTTHHTPDPPMEKVKIFVSYRHESPDFKAQVGSLIHWLAQQDKIEVISDQAFFAAPPQGWWRWMEQSIEEADVVLVVCTAGYRANVEGRDMSEGGRGTVWEGAAITGELYEAKRHNTKFIPIQPDGEPFKSVPKILRAFHNGLTFPSKQDIIYKAVLQYAGLKFEKLTETPSGAAPHNEAPTPDKSLTPRAELLAELNKPRGFRAVIAALEERRDEMNVIESTRMDDFNFRKQFANTPPAQAKLKQDLEDFLEDATFL